MKTLNPIEGFINQTIKSYFDLCQLADEVYQMGNNSGPKRSIICFLGQKADATLAELAEKFPDRGNADKWRVIISELVKSGLVSLANKNSHSILNLTPAGKQKVQEIVKFEASLSKHLPTDVSISDIRKSTAILEKFGNAVETCRKDYEVMNGKNHSKAKVG